MQFVSTNRFECKQQRRVRVGGDDPDRGGGGRVLQQGGGRVRRVAMTALRQWIIVTIVMQWTATTQLQSHKRMAAMTRAIVHMCHARIKTQHHPPAPLRDGAQKEQRAG